MSSYDLFFWLSGIIGILGSLPYLWGIFRGNVKPHRVSWLIWGTLTLINVFSQHAAGATSSLVFSVISSFFCLLFFVISIWKGVGGHTRLDIYCLMGAVIGLLLWRVTGNPYVSLGINIVIDLMGVIPMVRKTAADPHSENLTTFALGSVSALLSVLAEPHFILSYVVFPLYVTVANLVVVSVGLHARNHIKPAKRHTR